LNLAVLIICHPLKLIFIKTKKVGGTSFEVALTKYCSDECVITPISHTDEQYRQKHVGRGPQNHLEDHRLGIDQRESPNFRVLDNFGNHSPALHVREALNAQRFRAYQFICIHRDPADFLISQYFYRLNAKSSGFRSFSEWYSTNKHNVFENYVIAPLTGKNACDIVLNYADLENQLKTCNALPKDFWETFTKLNLKGQFRPSQSRNVPEFYASHNLDHTEPSRLLTGLL
jgi:hypothetical protein